MHRILVIGAGPSGLAVAHHLAPRADVRVLEAERVAGGNVRTEETDGWRTERGPHAVLDREPATGRLAEALGLRIVRAAPAARRRYFLRGGKLVAVTPFTLLGGRVMGLGSLARALSEPLVRARADPEESLASFVVRRFGAGALPLVSAVAAGIYGGDAERLAVGAAFPRLHAMEKDAGSVVLGALRDRGPRAGLVSFEGGLGALTGALAKKLGERLVTGAAAERALRAGAGWRVAFTRDGAREELVGDAVILTVPAHRAAPLIAPLAPAASEALAAIPYSPLALVHLGYPAAALARWSGFGFLADPADRAPILGSLWISSVFPDRAPAGKALCTVFLGGARDPTALALDDAALVTRAHGALAGAMDFREEPIWSRVVRHPRAVPQYERGHLARIAAADAAEAAHPGLFLAGNSLRGVGLNDCLRYAEPLAERVLAFLPHAG